MKHDLLSPDSSEVTHSANNLQLAKDVPVNSMSHMLWGSSLAVLISILYLHSSELAGPLAADLGYDDVVYARDAASRLFLLETKGIPAVLKDLVENPPHSVFSTALAVVGFMLGGVSEFTLYASNTIILLALVAFVGSELKASHRSIMLATFALLLFSPLSRHAIQDFRPDFALGLSSAMMVIWYLRRAVNEDKRAGQMAGMALGASLLIKPTFFAHTIAIALLLTSISISNNFLVNRNWNLFPRISSSAIFRFWGIGLAISLPYIVLNGSETAAYFWSNTRGESAQIWSHAKNADVSYLVRAFYSYIFALAKYHFHLSIGVIVVALAILIRHRQGGDVKRILLQIAIAFASLVIIVYGRHKNEFFLSTFLWLLILTAGSSMALACELIAVRHRTSIVAFILLVIMITGIFNSLASPQTISHEVSRGPNSWNEIVFNIIRKDFSSINGGSNDNRPRVFFSFAGRVNGDTVAWIGYRNRYVIDSSGAFISNDLNELQTRANNFDYLVVPNPIVAEYERGLPSGKIQGPVLTWAIDNPTFAPIQPLMPDQNYFVFRNRNLQEKYHQVISAPGIFSIEGFLPQEGPYPAWSLPKVRWMVSRKAHICFFKQTQDIQEVLIRARSDVSGTLSLTDENGVSLGEASFKPHIFQEGKFQISPDQRSSCFDLEFVEKQTLNSDRRLLFSKIEFVSSLHTQSQMP